MQIKANINSINNLFKYNNKIKNYYNIKKFLSIL